MGKQGSVLATRKNPTPKLIPAEEAKVVDTTGAGDAFVGALAFFMVRSCDYFERLITQKFQTP